MSQTNKVISEKINTADFLYPSQEEFLGNLRRYSSVRNLEKQLERSVLSKPEIEFFSRGYQNMISPFRDEYIWNGLSGGCGQNGYDIALGDKWSHVVSEKVDTKDIKGTLKMENVQAESFTLLPGQTILAVSEECFNLPQTVFAIAVGKSTIARLGLNVKVTPLESGWKGHLTIEIANDNDKTSIELWRGLPILQLIFFHVAQSQYEGRYQGQTKDPIAALGNK